MNFDFYLKVPMEDAASQGKFPGLILIHEIWGLDHHMKSVADRFAEAGFVTIAPELFGDTGILEKMGPNIFKEMQDPEKRLEAQAKMREIMQPIQTKEFAESALAKMEECFEELMNHPQCNGKIAILGFCFGGTMSFFLATKEPRLRAAVVFYGQPPAPLSEVENISCPVLNLAGEKDERVLANLPTLEAEMAKYHKDYTVKVYKNTGHAFFNEENKPAYNKEAALDAWTTVLDFLGKNLK